MQEFMEYNRQFVIQLLGPAMLGAFILGAIVVLIMVGCFAIRLIYCKITGKPFDSGPPTESTGPQ